MRKIAIFVLGAVLVGANLSYAMETGLASNGETTNSERPPGGGGSEHHGRRDRNRTLLSCRFVGIGIPLPPPPLVGGGLGKAPGKDPSMGLPGAVPGPIAGGGVVAPGALPGGFPGAVPGVFPGAVPGPFPGAYPGFGPVGGPLPVGPGVGLPLAGGPIPLMNNCSAVARLVDRDRSRDDRDDDDWDGEDRLFRNEFAVSCEGIPVYADTGIRSRIAGFEFLTGIVGDPILKLVRDRALDGYDRCDEERDRESCRHDDRRSGVVPAWLMIRGRVLEGFCAVERDRHHDEEHHHDGATLK